MPAFVFATEAAGSRIYRVGRVGMDSVGNDAGGAFTSLLRTEKISPAGEDGLCYFRRVALRVWRTGAFKCTMKVWVDGKRTQRWSSGVKIDQSIAFDIAAPTMSPDEAVIEASIEAQGTYVEVELTLSSADVSGMILPESMEVHYLPIRPSKSRSNAEAY